MLRTSLQAWLPRNVEGPLEDLAGGKSRLRIIVMLACILALDGAFPPVDAARLDVMHSRLWGRAEGVRSTIVYLAQAASPPLFGWLSALLGGHGGFGFGTAGGASGGQAAAIST